MRRHVVLFSMLFSFLLVSAAFAQNNRSAVSITGSDLNPCTVPAPCRTFGPAISVTNIESSVAMRNNIIGVTAGSVGGTSTIRLSNSAC